MASPKTYTACVFCRLGRKDAAAVAGMERRCFPFSAWSEQQLLAALGRKTFFAFALKEGGVLVAYATVYHTAGELEILNIAVNPAQRRQGLGKRLLGLVLREAGKMGILRSVLEVRPSNAAAIALYAAHGYKQVGIRPGYYPDTAEDALIYAKEFV
jgi:ribosomal-protein-alanine N-acetyltransferase